jgi:hypothetical protein
MQPQAIDVVRHLKVDRSFECSRKRKAVGKFHGPSGEGLGFHA